MRTELQEKGHIKDTKKLAKNAENSEKNKHLWLITKKTEKIVTAVYILTDFFDDREMLKWELRRSALGTMSFIAAFSGRVRDPRGAPALSDVYGALEDVVTLLEISSRTRLISQMNFAVLERELRGITESVEVYARYYGTAQEVSLPSEVLKDTEGRERTEESSPAHSHGGEKTNAKGQKSKRQENKQGEYKRQSSVNEKDIEKRARKDAIVSFLRTNEGANIKDISRAVSGSSEKTIQRDLLSLIQEGLVVREGERRWSVYRMRQ